jgi:hypothetical protein
MYKGTLFIIKYNYVCADCFDGEISCDDTTNNGISTCIEEKNWCNGNFDCPKRDGFS